tara:strand:- start:429 stop:959 length:531 start_codon:yes stop_codon:yes gene_type:complete
MLLSEKRLQSIESSLDGWRKSAPDVEEGNALLMRLIRASSLGISSCVDPILRESGLTESSFHTLVVTTAAGAHGITASGLCAEVGQGAANMTRILKLLETLGLAKLRADSNDARRRRAIATARGKALVHSYGKKLAPVINESFSDLSEKEKSQLHDLLYKVMHSLGRAELMARKLG